MLQVATLLFAAATMAPPPRRFGESPDIVGIWRAEGADVPALRGQMVVERGTRGWIASVGNVRATAPANASSITFPNGAGALRLQVSGAAFSGIWIQPGSAIDSNAYATPLHFSAAGYNRWSADLRPYTPHYELFVRFTRNTDGSLGGFIRDPIGNFGTMTPFLGVHLSGKGLSVVTRTHRYVGTLTDDPNVITLSIGAGAPPTFRRVAGSEAIGFLPRANSDVSLTRPAETGDGWATTTLADEHIDGGPIAIIVNRLASDVPSSPRSPFIQGLLVARNGKLLVDQYFYGFDGTMPHDVRSAGKSLDSALFGIALKLNPKLHVASPAYRWLPYQSFHNPDPRKQRISIADLFDMTSGLACDDNDDNSPGNEDTMQSQTGELDWYRYIMDLPMLRDPGSEPAVYCSGGLNVLGGIIAGATLSWTPRFFEEQFARPLTFGEYHLQLTPRNEMYLGGGGYFLPRDFLKLGQLFLQGGRWNGNELFSHAWAKDAVSPHSGLINPGDYGYSWHLTTYAVRGATYGAYEAQGNGGQYLIVVPTLRLVIEITAANYGDYFTWRTFHDLIAQPVLAACQ